MKPYTTAGELFDLAIRAEQVAEAGYRKLAGMFERHVGDLMVGFPARFGNAGVRRSIHVAHELSHLSH